MVAERDHVPRLLDALDAGVRPCRLELLSGDRPFEFGPLDAAAGLHRERASVGAGIADAHRSTVVGGEIALAQLHGGDGSEVVGDGLDQELAFAFDDRTRRLVVAARLDLGPEVSGELPVPSDSPGERLRRLRVDRGADADRCSAQFVLSSAGQLADVGDLARRAVVAGSSVEERDQDGDVVVVAEVTPRARRVRRRAGRARWARRRGATAPDTRGT